MKKIISFALAVVMIAGLFSVIPMTVTAEESSTGVTEPGAVPTGYVPVGTAITNQADFASMKANGKYYLTKDIDIAESYASKFTGTLDGNGHSITLGGKPIFKSLGSCTVKNLTIWGSVTVAGAKTTAGAIVGTVSGSSVVAFENIVNNAPVTSAYRAGGLVGMINDKSYARFVRCVNNAPVIGSNMLGGILGYTEGYTLEMFECVNNGKVASATANGICGGMVGRHGGDTKLLDKNGNIAPSGSAALIPDNRFAHIVNCKNTGEIYSKTDAAGIIGHARSSTVYITGCINEGKITSEGSNAAGIAANIGAIKTYEIKDEKGNSIIDEETGKAVTKDWFYYVTLNITNCVNTGEISMTAASPSGTINAAGIAGYVYGAATTALCRINKCINLGTIYSTFYASQLLGYSNNANNEIKNSIAAGKVEKYNNSSNFLPVVFGLSSAKPLNFKISNNYYLENDGTEWFSYATADSNKGNRKSLSDFLKDPAQAGKINLFTAEYLASGKVGAQFNKAVGEEMLYQKIGEDAAPTTDSTRGSINLPITVTKLAVVSAEDFAAMKPYGYYVLEADITISATYAEEFIGTFDGNGHTVTTSVPLFDKLKDATVKNLTINGNIVIGGSAGALSANASKVTVNNVVNNANITSTSKGAYVGGIVGACNQGFGSPYEHEYSRFTDCVNNGDLTASNGTPRVGGIVGNAARYQHCVYTNCVNNGNINVVGEDLSSAPYVAGIAASSFGGDFINCVNNGDLYSTAGAHMGGILGRGTPSAQGTDQSSKAVGCVNTGNLEINSTGSGAVGGIFGQCGIAPGSTATRAIYSAENCVNFGTLTSNGNHTGGIIGYVYGNNNTVVYSYGVVKNCVNVGKLVGTKKVVPAQENDTVTFRATYLSHFIGYVNASKTVIENCYGFGTLENTNDNYNAIFGLSSDTALNYKVSHVYLAPNDGTKNFSYGHDAMADAKDENGKVIKVLDDRSRNRVAITAASEKVTVLTEAALSGNKVTELCNTLVGKELLYNNFSRDVNARTYSYGGKFFRLTEAGASVRAFADQENATVGVRFRSLISKDAFDAIQKDVAEIGVIIAPKVLADAAGEMTFEALEAYKASSGKANVYISVKRSGAYATSFSAEELTNGCYEIKGSLVNIKDASMEFAAVGYIKLKNGTVFYGSTDVNSAKAIATAAVADVKAAAETGYEYEVEAGVFSPYTKKAYESLQALAK